MDPSSFYGMSQQGSKEMDAELMDLDSFGDSMAVGSCMEDCEEMEFAELSPSSYSNFFNTPFFSLFSLPPATVPVPIPPPAEDLRPVQDQGIKTTKVKEGEEKIVVKEEQVFESNPITSPCVYGEKESSSSKQDQFVRLDGFQDRNNTFAKPNPSTGSSFEQAMDSGIPENRFGRSYNDQKEPHDDLANRRPEPEIDVFRKTVKTCDRSSLLKERMTQALRYIKASSGKNVLAQVWAPVKRDGKRVLTTYGQPYTLDPSSDKLINFRTVSLDYEFSADENSDGDLGLPGRVFLRKMPEWTPNVQYYSSKEYPRAIHAQIYNVQGCLALPVFESENQSCVGVVELIMTAQKIHYASEVEKVCKALQAVNLRSSEVLDHQKSQIYNEIRQAVLPEILEVLTAVCETHKLPLAQTWVPCRHCNAASIGDDKKGSCVDIDGRPDGQVCMSTIVDTCYVTDPRMLGFQGACSEQHLLKGQGVPGKALASNQPYFSADITTFSKMEYPLLHYARMFALRAAVAIRLRSTLTGNDDYVLEFFLPVDCKDLREQQVMLNSLSTTMQSVCRSLRTVSDEELENDRLLEITEGFGTGRINLNGEVQNQGGANLSRESPEQEWKQHDLLQETLLNSHNQMMQQPVEKIPSANNDEKQYLCQERLAISDQMQQHHQDSAGVHDANAAVHSIGESTSSSSVQENVNIRRRGKVEKNISLPVLQQYFAGSLKDAAKSIGVCPTTLKRICRQHGISRWPSRKISKVNHSIRKLQIVIESVQGVEGAFKFGPVENGSFSPTALSNLQMGNISFNRGNSWTADVKGETSSMANIAPTQTHEVSASGQISPGTAPEKLTISQSLPSVLACKEKAGGQAYAQTFNPGACAPFVEGSFLQVKGGYRKGIDSSRGFAGTPKSSDCSKSSSSSHHCSNEADPNDQVNSNRQENGQINGHNGQLAFPALKRAHSERLLNDKTGGLPARSSSYKCMDSALNKSRNSGDKGKYIQEYSQPSPPQLGFNLSPMNTNDPWTEKIILPGRFQTARICQEEFTLTTVKATYKEDTVRFKLSPHMGFQELCEEVAKRFQLESGTINLRYLDDDSEWVLLTCDADLFECIDIFKSLGGRTIKFLVQDVSLNIGSSCGSTGGF